MRNIFVETDASHYHKKKYVMYNRRFRISAHILTNVAQITWPAYFAYNFFSPYVSVHFAIKAFLLLEILYQDFIINMPAL